MTSNIPLDEEITLPHRQDIALGAVAVTAVVLSETLVQWSFASFLGQASFFGLTIFLLAILVGIRARWGVAVGALASGTVFGSLDTGVALAVAGFTATTVCTRVWTDPDRNSLGWVGHALGVALLTVVSVAAMRGLIAAILAIGSFDVVFVQSLQLLLVPTIAGVPLVWVLIGRFPEARPRVPTSQRTRRLVAAIVVVWGVAGYMVSFLFEAFALVPGFVVAEQLGGTAAAIVQALALGDAATVMVGITAVTALAVVIKLE